MDLLPQIADRLQHDYAFKVGPAGKHLRQGVCPSCGKKSLWTFADSPWVVRCERLNHCGYEAHAKDLYPDLFESWSDRFQAPEAAKPEAERNPHAAADAYLSLGRGFDLARIKGLYTQESFYDTRADAGRGAGTATVRFQLADTWWERLIDRPGRFSKKANFKTGGSYAGTWWALPDLNFNTPDPQQPDAPQPPRELWLVEGIFDAIALSHQGVPAVALMSCNNYPEHELARLRDQLARQGGTVPEPTLVWALDGDKAGRDYTLRHVRRARNDGWTCAAAQIPQRGRAKLDWNDLHQRDQLQEQHLKDYRYHGALLVAQSAQDKALVIYNHTGRAEFDLVHSNRLWWFKLDMERYKKASAQLEEDIADGHKPAMSDDDKRALILTESGTLSNIANCNPQALYYQANPVTQEAWYYFRVQFPHDSEVRGTFTAGQLVAASEFKKQLLHIAPGAMFTGSSNQLERIMQRQLDNPKIVQTVDFIGYSAQHKAYILGPVAVKGGRVIEANAEDYFEIDRLAIKTLQRSIKLDINLDPAEYTRDWYRHLWNAFGARGVVALAYWVGSLFAEQIRAEHKSFPFLEIVGEPGAGKTTLIQFLWKLFGRDYEGFDPSKSTSAGRMRTFTQVSNLPIVLIESDRETKTGGQAHVKSFDWDELKDAYNGNSIRTTGVKTGGNETYDPPFRASFVISQNNPVQASQAIMERICHMTFGTKGFTPLSFEAAKALERIDGDSVSGFLLEVLKHEAEITDLINDQAEPLARWIMEQDGITKPRIAKNHGQLLAGVQALRLVVPDITDAHLAEVTDLLVNMARERQQSINADHPLVQEFWEAFDYLDGLPQHTASGLDTKPRLNHAIDAELIAVNLNEYVELAAQHRQQIPVLAELKKVLRTSKTRRYIDTKTVKSGVKAGVDGYGKAVYCWVFERPGRGR